MRRQRLVGFAAMLTVILGVAVLTQVTISPAPAQMMDKPKMTGRITEKVIAEFKDLNIPGIKNVKYVSFSAAPNARVENLTFDHAELCMAKRGNVVVTLPDGQVVRHKGGEIFIVPMGLKTKSVTFPGGFDETVWYVYPAK